jgi:hypothetical protein
LEKRLPQRYDSIVDQRCHGTIIPIWKWHGEFQFDLKLRTIRKYSPQSERAGRGRLVSMPTSVNCAA